jgi:hypothetical protein
MSLAVVKPQAFGHVLKLHVRNLKIIETMVLPRRQAREQATNELTFDNIQIPVPKGLIDMRSSFAHQIEAEQEAPHRAEINLQ